MSYTRRWNLVGEAAGVGSSNPAGPSSVPTPSYASLKDGEAEQGGANIFRIAYEAVKKAGTSHADARPDANLLVVGPRGAGKTSLLQRYLNPGSGAGNKSDAAPSSVPKSTEVLEYTFARKAVSSQSGADAVRVAHIWEAAGSKLLTDELTAGAETNESFLLSMRTITTSVVMVVVDLSKPSEVIGALMPWLDFVRRRSEYVHQRLESRGSKLPGQLRAKAAAFFGKSHDDVSAIINTGVPMIIVANKYDAFKDEDPELKRVMARVLRHAAHRYGASLVYTSTVKKDGGVGVGAQSATKDGRGGIESLTMLLNHLLFVGPEKKNLIKIKNQTDHMHALSVVAGGDRLQDIGRPSGGAGRDPFEDWGAAFVRTFPHKSTTAATAATGPTTPNLADYAEPDVDAVKARRDEELEMLKKEQRKEKQATVVSALQKQRRRASTRPQAAT